MLSDMRGSPLLALLDFLRALKGGAHGVGLLAAAAAVAGASAAAEQGRHHCWRHQDQPINALRSPTWVNAFEHALLMQGVIHALQGAACSSCPLWCKGRVLCVQRHTCTHGLNSNCTVVDGKGCYQAAALSASVRACTLCFTGSWGWTGEQTSGWSHMHRQGCVPLETSSASPLAAWPGVGPQPGHLC